MSRFQDDLALGLEAERLVASWLVSRGASVRRVVRAAGDVCGPRLYGPGADLILPDVDVSIDGARFWYEVKAHTHSGWIRMHGAATHWIKDEHRRHYLRVEQVTGTPAMLCVLEANGPSGGVNRADVDPGFEAGPNVLVGRHSEMAGFGCVYDHGHDDGRCMYSYFRDGFAVIERAPWASSLFVRPTL